MLDCVKCLDIKMNRVLNFEGLIFSGGDENINNYDNIVSIIINILLKYL